MKKIDVIIPLGTKDKNNNDELKILLRSLEMYAKDLGRIIICSPEYPQGFQNIEYLKVDDPLRHNKDGNIINKIHEALIHFNIDDDFIFSCDDYCLLQMVELSKLPPIYNIRNQNQFSSTSGNRWVRRVYNTFQYLKEKGINLTHNYQSHTPQRYNGALIKKVLIDIPYMEEDKGFSINTLFMGLCGITDGELQNDWKVTFETDNDLYQNLDDKTFCGYNDFGFSNGIKQKLFQLFPVKSDYEI